MSFYSRCLVALLSAGCLLIGAPLQAEDNEFNSTQEESTMEKGWFRGKRGHHGHHGHRGKKGRKGSKGRKGPRGCPGRPGEEGPQGPTGDTGPAGGPKGDTGDPGPKGDPGDPGPVGPTGASGAPGEYGYAAIEPSTPIPVEQGLIPFESNVITSENISYNSVTREFTIGIPGVYDVGFFFHAVTEAISDNVGAPGTVSFAIVKGGLDTVFFEASAADLIGFPYPQVSVSPWPLSVTRSVHKFIEIGTVPETIAIKLVAISPGLPSLVYLGAQTRDIGAACSIHRIGDLPPAPPSS